MKGWDVYPRYNTVYPRYNKVPGIYSTVHQYTVLCIPGTVQYVSTLVCWYLRYTVQSVQYSTHSTAQSVV